MLWLPAWKSLRPHNLAVGSLIWIQFGGLTQSAMAMMMRRWKWKPEVEFWHGGLLSRNMDRDMSRVDFDLPNWVQSPKMKSEVKLPHCGWHHEKSMWRHNSTGIYAMWIKFSSLRLLDMHIQRALTGRKTNTRQGGNYSDVLPLKAAWRLSNLTSFGASNLSCRQT